MHAVVIGNTTIDEVWTLADALVAGGKHRAVVVRTVVGGQASNAAFTLAALGCSVRFLGVFGDDAGSDDAQSALIAAGVQLGGSVRAVGVCHPRATVLVGDDGERTIALHKPPALAAWAPRVDLASLHEATALYLDGHEPAIGLAAAQIAATRGLPVILDAEVVDAGIRALLPFATAVIAPAATIRALARRSATRDALHALCNQGRTTEVVATLGADGAIGFDGTSEIAVPAAPCAVRDTTGAGDAFHAAFLAGLLAELGLEARLVFAARVAAIACSVSGPRLSADDLVAARDELGRRGRGEVGA